MHIKHPFFPFPNVLKSLHKANSTVNFPIHQTASWKELLLKLTSCFQKRKQKTKYNLFTKTLKEKKNGNRGKKIIPFKGTIGLRYCIPCYFRPVLFTSFIYAKSWIRPNWTNFNKTWHKTPFGKGHSTSGKLRISPFYPREIIVINWFFFLIKRYCAIDIRLRMKYRSFTNSRHFQYDKMFS